MIAVFNSSNHQHKEYLSVVLFAYNRWSLCCDKLLNVQYRFFCGGLRGMEHFQKMGVGRERKKGDSMPKRFEALYNHPLYMLGRQINSITCKKTVS